MTVRRLPLHPVYLSLALVVMLGVLTPIINPVRAGYELLISQDMSAQYADASPVDHPRLPSLREFITEVRSGRSHDLVGVYVPGLMAFPIVEQPSGKDGYVSSKQDVVTLFGLAKKNNAIGLLAHNTLAGKDFNKLLPLMRVILIYGNGRIQTFLITDVKYFRALEPYSPYSTFEDVENLGVYLTAGVVFNQIYGDSDRLIFQTCIEADGNLAWGRLFVIADLFTSSALGATGSQVGIEFNAQ